MNFLLTYVKYLEKKIPDHDSVYHHVAQKVKKIAKDESYLDVIVYSMEESDAVICSFPLYRFLLCKQMMGFLEILTEKVDLQ